MRDHPRTRSRKVCRNQGKGRGQWRIRSYELTFSAITSKLPERGSPLQGISSLTNGNNSWLHLVALRWQHNGVGDALNYGASRFGEKYTQAMEVTGHSYQALANYSWVARSIPNENRNPNLSWTHHRAVCKLDHTEQKRVLTEAAIKGWSVDVLTEIVRGTPLTEPKLSDVVHVPVGLSQREASNVLETAACLVRDDVQLCPMCPYKR